MGNREELIEKAVINLVVENEQLKIELKKAEERGDLWWKNFQSSEDRLKAAEDMVNIKAMENRKLIDKLENSKAKVKKLESIIDADNE